MNTPRALITIILLVILAGVAYAVMGRTPDSPETSMPQENISTTKTHASEKYGITFSYPDSYQLAEIDTPGSAMREHHIITLIRTADLPAPEGGEGPPAITIEMFQNNLDNQTTEGWIRGSSDSNFKLSEGTLASIAIDGKPALSYRWSGLYEGTTIAIARPDWVYAFSVTYLEMGADIVQDFVQIRDSIRVEW